MRASEDDSDFIMIRTDGGVDGGISAAASILIMKYVRTWSRLVVSASA
eukprot:COSAG02_NODE_28118_length_589_cov_0.521127_1_plen_47_part_01